MADTVCGLSAGLRTERSLAQFAVRAQARAAGLVPGQGTHERQLIDVSLTHQSLCEGYTLMVSSLCSSSLPHSLKVNIFFLNIRKWFYAIGLGQDVLRKSPKAQNCKG